MARFQGGRLKEHLALVYILGLEGAVNDGRAAVGHDSTLANNE